MGTDRALLYIFTACSAIRHYATIPRPMKTNKKKIMHGEFKMVVVDQEWILTGAGSDCWGAHARMRRKPVESHVG